MRLKGLDKLKRYLYKYRVFLFIMNVEHNKIIKAMQVLYKTDGTDVRDVGVKMEVFFYVGNI